MPAFVASAVFGPRSCPSRVTGAVCAVLALSPFVPVVAVALNTDLPPWQSLAAQPDMPYVLPAVVEPEGGTIISESVYVPIARESRPRPPYMDPPFRFRR
jgi:hypothetical protein